MARIISTKGNRKITKPHLSNFPGSDSKHPPISLPYIHHIIPTSYLAGLSENEENQNPIIRDLFVPT